jgi:hypothetical protein
MCHDAVRRVAVLNPPERRLRPNRQKLLSIGFGSWFSSDTPNLPLPSKKISLDLQIINPEWRTIDTAVSPRARHASDRKSKQGSRVEKECKKLHKNTSASYSIA